MQRLQMAHVLPDVEWNVCRNTCGSIGALELNSGIIFFESLMRIGLAVNVKHICTGTAILRNPVQFEHALIAESKFDN